jgi:hypothetical protein
MGPQTAQAEGHRFRGGPRPFANQGAGFSPAPRGGVVVWWDPGEEQTRR